MPHGKQKHQFSAVPHLKALSPLKEEFSTSRQTYFSQRLPAPFSPKSITAPFLQTGRLRHGRVNSVGSKLISSPCFSLSCDSLLAYMRRSQNDSQQSLTFAFLTDSTNRGQYPPSQAWPPQDALRRTRIGGQKLATQYLNTTGSQGGQLWKDDQDTSEL